MKRTNLRPSALLRKEERAERFIEDVEEGKGLTLERADWSQVFRQAESLARRFSPTLGPGSHDLVLVATAVTLGGTWFLSFDSASRQRALASAAGLFVWPPLDKNEKGLVRFAASQTLN